MTQATPPSFPPRWSPAHRAPAPAPDAGPGLPDTDQPGGASAVGAPAEQVYGGTRHLPPGGIPGTPNAAAGWPNRRGPADEAAAADASRPAEPVRPEGYGAVGAVDWRRGTPADFAPEPRDAWGAPVERAGGAEPSSLLAAELAPPSAPIPAAGAPFPPAPAAGLAPAVEPGPHFASPLGEARATGSSAPPRPWAEATHRPAVDAGDQPGPQFLSGPLAPAPVPAAFPTAHPIGTPGPAPALDEPARLGGGLNPEADRPAVGYGGNPGAGHAPSPPGPSELAGAPEAIEPGSPLEPPVPGSPAVQHVMPSFPPSRQRAPQPSHLMSLAYRERIRLAERLPEPIYPFPAGPPDFVPAPATSPGPPVSSPGPADWGGISSPTPAAAPDAPIPAMPASAAPFVAAGAPTAVGQPTSVPAWPVDSEPPMTDQEPPAASAEPRADSAQPSAAVGFELLVQSGDSAPPPLVGGPSACPAPTQGGPQGLLDSEAAPPDGLEQRTILAAAPAAPNTADLARQNPWLTVLWAAALVACTVGFALRALTETALPLAAADLLTMLGAASAVGAIVLAGVNWAIRRPPPPSGNAHEGRPL